MKLLDANEIEIALNQELCSSKFDVEDGYIISYPYFEEESEDGYTNWVYVTDPDTMYFLTLDEYYKLTNQQKIEHYDESTDIQSASEEVQSEL